MDINFKRSKVIPVKFKKFVFIFVKRIIYILVKLTRFLLSSSCHLCIYIYMYIHIHIYILPCLSIVNRDRGRSLQARQSNRNNNDIARRIFYFVR